MPEEPYFRPGTQEDRPPQARTLFTPQKPAGPDPVSPQPVAEGSDIARHAQLYALDPATGQFHPVDQSSGRLAVDTAASWTPIQTLLNRDVEGRVQEIVETDGTRTKTTTIARNPDGTVASLSEVVV